MRRVWWAIKYAWLTVKHKWFVFRAGLKMGVPIWRLAIHDFSKFGPGEIFAYGRQFFGDRGDPDGFSRAWLHHQNVNPHHWEYWITRSGHNRGKQGGKGWHESFAMPMPKTYVREMIADWMGASRAYTGSWNMDDWLKKNLWRMDLHLETVDQLLMLLPLSGSPQPDRPSRQKTSVIDTISSQFSENILRRIARKEAELRENNMEGYRAYQDRLEKILEALEEGEVA